MGVLSWALDAARNAFADPAVAAADGASGRQIPASLRALMAATRALADDQGGALTTVGSANAYVLATASGVTALRSGLTLSFWADRANTDAPSLNVDGTGPRPWCAADGAPLAAGVVQPGRVYTVTYNPTLSGGAWVTPSAVALLKSVSNGALADAPGLTLKGNPSPGTGAPQDVLLADLAGSFGLGIARAQIASRIIPVTAFRTTDGAPWVRGGSSGPMATQDAAGTWWQIDTTFPRLNARWFVLPSDGGDAGKVLTRMASLLNSIPGGGVAYFPSGDWVFVTQGIINKTANASVVVEGDGVSTRFIPVANLASAYIYGGNGTNIAGGDLVFRKIQFAGGNKTVSRAIRLENSNGTVFDECYFEFLFNGIDMTACYAVSFVGCRSRNVTGNFVFSSTSAHHLKLLSHKAYDSGEILRIEVASDNIEVVGDFENCGCKVRMPGGTSLSFRNSYSEYSTDVDLDFTGGTMLGASIVENWLAYGVAWPLANLQGGEFKRNRVVAKTITAAPSVIDTEFADNSTGSDGGVAGTVPRTPYQAPVLANGWTPQGGYTPPGFRKGNDGRVHLYGEFINASSPTLGTDPATTARAFTLPVGYRPATTAILAVSGTSGLSRLWVYPSGAVVVVATGGAGTAGNPYQAGMSGASFEPA